MGTFLKRFAVRGVFWRQLTSSGARNVPPWAEPWLIWWWSGLFMLVWHGGRRGAMKNFSAMFPASGTLRNLARTYKLFVNFAWTYYETGRFQEKKALVDWELDGVEHFREMEQTGGAIILTAHMGNYDLGAYFFSEKMKRPLHIVRMPESDELTEAHSITRRAAENLRVSYNTSANALAIDLLSELRSGRFVAIQGDRVVGGVARVKTTMFGANSELPSGPFALAMIARVPLFPLFVVRTGHRSYRVIVRRKIECVAVGREREAAIQRAADEWRDTLQEIAREYWYQWFEFESFVKESA